MPDCLREVLRDAVTEGAFRGLGRVVDSSSLGTSILFPTTLAEVV